MLVPNRDERLNDSKNIVYAPIDDPRWREEDLQDTWAEEFSPSLMDEATPRSSPRRLKRHRSLSQDGDELNPLLAYARGLLQSPLKGGDAQPLSFVEFKRRICTEFGERAYKKHTLSINLLLHSFETTPMDSAFKPPLRSDSVSSAGTQGTQGTPHGSWSYYGDSPALSSPIFQGPARTSGSYNDFPVSECQGCDAEMSLNAHREELNALV